MFSSSLELGLSNWYHSSQWFLRCSEGLPSLLLGHELFYSDLAVNDFTVLLSPQHPRDVLTFSILIVVVVLIAPDEVETEGALWQPGCPAGLMLKPCFRTRTDFFTKPFYLTLFLFQLPVIWTVGMVVIEIMTRDTPCVPLWLVAFLEFRGREREIIEMTMKGFIIFHTFS